MLDPLRRPRGWRRARRAAFRLPGQLLALFLLVVGARFFLLARYGSSLPFWDQWDGVGALLLRPWFSGRFDWHILYAPHNEHRILLTRVLTLAVTIANGQWDNLVEAAVNAVLCGVSAVLIGRTLIATLGRAYQGRVLLALAGYFVLPFGWENTLVGFQSQNYFLILFSLAAVWGLGTRRAGSAGWWVGLLGAGLACLSMASGMLAAAAVLGLRGLRLARERGRPGVDDLVTGALCLGLVAAGWFTRAVVPAHRVLQAESPGAFVAAGGRFLAWPWCDHPGQGWLELVPLGALAAVYLWPTRRRPVEQSGEAAPPGALLLLGAGAWAWLQGAAMAYGRGGQGAFPAPRYLDLLALVPLVNFFAWQILARRTRRTRWHGVVRTGFVLWLGWLGVGLWDETRQDITGALPEFRAWTLRNEHNVHGYVATHDFDRYLSGDPPRELPHPSGRLVADLVDDPVIRALLPAVVRPALAVQPLPGGSSAFVPGGVAPGTVPLDAQRTRGSYTGADPRANQGTFRARIVAPSALPYLRFAFAGDFGAPGLSLAMSGEGDQAPLRRQEPSRTPAPGRWHEDTFPKPGHDIFLEATDHDPARWFAFNEPVELSFGSRWTGFLLRQGGTIFAVGAVLGAGWLLSPLAAWLVAVRRWQRRRRLARSEESGPNPEGAKVLRLFSVVMPARDEEGCIAATVEGLSTELVHAGVPHEILVVDDGSRDRTWPILTALAARVPALRPVQNPGPHGFGRAIIYGLDRMQGDAVAIMMADASDQPADVVRYWQTLGAGYDCVFGSRFVRGSRVVDYPWFKLAVNRLANGFIRGLFRVGLNDTTNAFKAYRREVIAGCRPLISTQFNLTVELPLKAIVRGFSWAVVPITWTNRRTGAAKFRLKEMGSRYLFICLYLWLEKHLSRGDYRRQKI